MTQTTQDHLPGQLAGPEREGPGVSAPPSRAKPTIRDRIMDLGRLWARSLQTRVVTTLVVCSVAFVGLMGVILVNQIRVQTFDERVSTIVDEFSSAVVEARTRFSSTASSNPGQMQQTANEIIASQYDPGAAVVGAMLMRSPGQDGAAVALIEPSSVVSTAVRGLVSSDLRQQVAGAEGLHWQSVGIPTPDGDDIPGIVIGAPVDIPGTGAYELYAIYTLADEVSMLDTVRQVLVIGATLLVLFLTIIAWLLSRMVLRPIRQASQTASQIADGAFEVRMTVRGEDELAQLARSFNTMARSLDEQFTRLDRLSKVQQGFVSAVSHELRSPVTTIRMAGQLVYDRRDELSAPLRRSSELMHGQLIHLDQMLSDLLEISRFDAGSMALATEYVDVADIVQDVVTMAAPLAQDNNVDVTIDVHGATEAQVEARRIQRIVRNLVVNALEHAEGQPVVITVAGNDSAVAVRVVDHGVGISQEQADHVFDRFWRADSARKRKTGGTGLGLTIAREDAVLHGGEIEVWGVLGQGSSFMLVVPKEPGTTYESPLMAEVSLEIAPVESTGSTAAADVVVRNEDS